MAVTTRGRRRHGERAVNISKDSGGPASNLARMGSLRNAKTLLAVVYLLILTAAVYNTALLPGRTILPADLLLLTPPWKQHSQELMPGFTAVSRPAWDPLFQFYPARKFLADSLHAGRVPLWNPSSFSGTPFAADGQSAVFYPFNWLFAWLPLAMAFGWIAALHTFLTGLFFVMYGRRMGWGWAASLTGATAWMLCGVMVVWQMWQVVDDSLCWLPLALFFWEGWRRSGKRPEVAGAGIALGMSALAGHLQFTCYVYMAVLAYGVFRSVQKTDTAPTDGNPAQSLWALAVAFAIGIGISSVQLLATADFLGHTNRAQLPLATLLGTAMPPAQLLMLAAPDILGGQRDWTRHPFIGQYGQPFYYEFTSFCGAAALAFALYGVRWRPSDDPARGRTLFWLGLGIFALLMGCGSPLYAIFYYGVPLFKSFHGPARILVLLDFAVAILAAEGVQRLSAVPPLERRAFAGRVLAALAVLLLLGYRFAVTGTNQSVAFALTHMEPDGWMVYGLTQIGIAFAAITAACAVIAWAPPRIAWSALAVVAVDSLVFAVGVNSSVPSNLLYPPTPETRYISQNLGNARVWCVGEPGKPQSKIVPNSAMALGWNDIAGSDPLVLKTYQPISDELDRDQQNAPAAGDAGSVQPARDRLDRLNVRYIVSPRPLSDAGLTAAYEGDVYVYENPNAFGVGRFASAGTQPSTPAAVEEFIPGHIRLSVPATDAGTLSTSIVFDPGWTAKVDSHPSAPTSDTIFLSVDVPAGSHSVDFDYRPASVFAGLYLSCVAWLIAATLAVSGFGAGRSIIGESPAKAS